MNYDLDRLFTELDAALEKANQPPEGTFWVGDVMERRDWKRSKAKTWIERLLDAGEIELAEKWGGRNYYRMKDVPASRD